MGQTRGWISWTSSNDPCKDFTALAALKDSPYEVTLNSVDLLGNLKRDRTVQVALKLSVTRDLASSFDVASV